MAIRAGELDTRIRIEEPSVSQDGAGEPEAPWSLVAERWASIARTPGSEVWGSAQRNGRVPTVFRLRYLAGVLPSMRVVVGTDVYDIKNVLPSVREGELLLITVQLVEETAS